MPISSHASSRRFLETLTDDESMTCCGNPFHSSIILFEKNVFRAVVLHLGLKSFCECPLNPYVSKAGWKNLALSICPFRWVFYTLQSGLHVVSVSPTSIFPLLQSVFICQFLEPFDIFVARLWICLRQSLSFIKCGDHACTQYFKCGRKYAL